MNQAIEATLTEACEVCQGAINPYEARMFFPGHRVQTHMTCGEQPRMFYQPVHSEAGNEAVYWTREIAEEAIKAYSGPEFKDEFAEGEWVVKEVTMTPAAYYQLPEFDGF